jgi:hypothetical protein
MTMSKLNPKKVFIFLFYTFCFLTFNPALWGDEVKVSLQSLPEGAGRELVVGNCTICHSEAIILQNHMGREEWSKTIDWMQKEQGMWELEEKDRNFILNYLSKYQGIDGEKGNKQQIQRKNQMYEFDYKPNPL